MLDLELCVIINRKLIIVEVANKDNNCVIFFFLFISLFYSVAAFVLHNYRLQKKKMECVIEILKMKKNFSSPNYY